MKAGSALLSLAGSVERFINAISVFAAWATVAPIALFSVVQVADRKLQLGISSFLPDISTSLLFIMIMLLFGFTYLRDGHVRVDVFRRHWPQRTLAMIEVFGCAFILLPLSIALCVYGWDGLMRTTRFAEFDVWAARIASVIGPGLLGLAGLVVITYDIAFLLRKRDRIAPDPQNEFLRP